MWSFALLSVALLFFQASAANVALIVAVPLAKVTLSETYIGQDKNVKIQYATCPEYGSKVNTLEARQIVDVCGSTCGDTSCFTPSGGGPNPNDCHIIADAMRFDSQKIGALFTIGTGTKDTVVMQFASCLTFFVNQDTSVPIAYCRTDWVLNLTPEKLISILT